MAEETSVQVGVRIRPFNERERKLGAELCIEMDGKTTIITPPPDLDKADEYGPGKGREREPKKFTFDASFWSHDGFDEKENGYYAPMPGSRYSDQQQVFEVFGKGVLDNAWQGYHCCLFAYGQTGSGKSYSMVGYGANKGIVPVSCEEIFRRIERNTDANLTYEVTVSMVEIYNEQVQDLLVAPRLRPKKGLEIRESQQLGIYIHGVAKRAVNTYASIEAVVDEGTTNRTVGATLMNATSSRAHTVLTLEFKQVSRALGQSGSKLSLINLVDLAGSEKAGQTGAQGDRLKEGCAINKSLSALGNVIEKLADKSTGKAKAGAVIPYRDSKLTRLLQNALGGSSKTVMICAISPASSNYEETLSTLRYADRAKRIKNAAIVNENPQDRLIRQLREENAKLREMANQTVQSGPSEQNSAELALKQEEIAALEEALREMQKSFAERLQEANAKAQEARPKEKKEFLTLPHLANLNEDQLLTNKLQFVFSEATTRIGRSNADKADQKPGEGEPEITLAGPGIHHDHAVVTKADGVCILRTHDTAITTTFINGKNPPAGEGVALMHGDRVAFGGSLFVFVDPEKGTAAELLDTGKVSYLMARKEVSAQDGGVSGVSEEDLQASKKRAEELESLVRKAEEAKHQAEEEANAMVRVREEEYKKRVEALEKDFARSLEEQAKKASGEAAVVQEQAVQHNHEELERLKRDFEERQRKAEEAAQRRIQELEAAVQKAAKEEDEHRQHQLMTQLLEEQLMHMMPLVREANLIAEELQKPMRLEAKMKVDLGGGAQHPRLVASVTKDNVNLYEWNPEMLENRVFLMRELLERCAEEGYQVAESLPKKEDPFWDPIEEERVIGIAHILLQGLLLQVENQLDARIYSPEGAQVGTLHLEVWPLAKDGTPGIPDEEAVDKPEDLIGSRMDILVKVGWAKGLPQELANDVRVEFEYFVDHRPHQVPVVLGHCCDPQFNHEVRLVQDPVTSQFLQYIKTKTLMFHVYGHHAGAAKLAKEEQETLFSPHSRAQTTAVARAGETASSWAPTMPSQPVAPLAHEELPPATAGSNQGGGVAGAGTANQIQTAPEHPPKRLSGSPQTAPPPSQGVPSASQVRREVEQVTAADTRGPKATQAQSKTCVLL